MLTVYAGGPTSLDRLAFQPGTPLPESAVWLDLVGPTPEEDRAVEAAVGAPVPTREEIQEIEVSSRLYVENGARYMSAALLYNSDSEQPLLANVGFILARNRLVTVRYEEPKPFASFANRACKLHPSPATGETILLGLLDAIVDRTADVLEKAGADIDEISNRIFERQGSRGIRRRNYLVVVRSLGRKGDLLSKARECLLTLGRMVAFLSTEVEGQKVARDAKGQLRSLARDVQSLSDHASYLGAKVTFLLDATLGMVSIEQNDIIKMFSIVSVMMMPPTLIASVYGMNFDYMPELHWNLGYPWALMLMVISAVVPYLFFRYKRWF